MVRLSVAWCYRVNARLCWPGVSVLRLDGTANFICGLHLSVAARAIVQADTFQRYANMLLGREATNKPTSLTTAPGGGVVVVPLSVRAGSVLLILGRKGTRRVRDTSIFSPIGMAGMPRGDRVKRLRACV